MAYFAWPEAHDHDAERAARAGLAILEAITKLNEHPARSRLAARVGIDSGAVVVGAGADKEADVFGDTPNIAARVQAIAEPGTVVITDAVHRLVSGCSWLKIAERRRRILRPTFALWQTLCVRGFFSRWETYPFRNMVTPHRQGSFCAHARLAQLSVQCRNSTCSAVPVRLFRIRST